MQKKKFKDYLNRRLLCIFFLGFSSGLPFALVFGSLQAWYTHDGVDIVTIGCLTLASQPYSYKFLWAPFLDRFTPSFLGKRRGWLLITQLLLSFFIIMMSFLTPSKYPLLLVCVGLILAFCSATYDIAFDAYRTEILPEDERGIGVALSVEGYRLAMLTSGALAMILADYIGWHNTYRIMAVLMIMSITATFFAPATKNVKATIKENVFYTFKSSIKNFLSRERAVLLLALIICYKLGDAFSHALTTPFLLKGIGFSQSQVGVISKTVGLIASLVGVFFGGVLMTRMGLFRALFLFGVLQGVTNLLYMLLAYVGKNYIFASTAVFIENLCGGMGTAAFVALIMSLCNKKYTYTATQFALLSSLAVFGRMFVGPVSGVLVKNIGWSKFYFISFLAALPSLFLLYLLRTNISSSKDNDDLDNDSDSDEENFRSQKVLVGA